MVDAWWHRWFQYKNDTYILPSGSTIWSYAGTAPWKDRANFAAAYNETDQSVYIWGGGNCDNTCYSSTYLNDTWHTPASNLSVWGEDTANAEFPARLLPQNGMSINSMYRILSISPVRMTMIPSTPTASSQVLTGKHGLYSIHPLGSQFAMLLRLLITPAKTPGNILSEDTEITQIIMMHGILKILLHGQKQAISCGLLEADHQKPR